MRRHPDRDGRQPGRHQRRQPRTRRATAAPASAAPARRPAPASAPGRRTRATVSTAAQIGQMHDQRVEAGPPLGLEDPRHRHDPTAHRRPGRRPSRSERRPARPPPEAARPGRCPSSSAARVRSSAFDAASSLMGAANGIALRQGRPYGSAPAFAKRVPKEAPMPYRAPVTDIRFILDHVVGFAEVTATPAFRRSDARTWPRRS